MSQLLRQNVLAALAAALFAAGVAGARDANAQAPEIQAPEIQAPEVQAPEAPAPDVQPESLFTAATAEQAAAPEVDVTPLGREVAAIRAAFSARLAELTARYRAAPDAAAAAEAQRAITALKLGLEMDMLDLQLRLARERNDAEAIAELETGRTVLRAHLAADTGQDVPASTSAGTDNRGERRP
ncbi:MAG: hypothetical protein IPO18_18395 [bacterium]|nr:hypothetical protein [bacterium]